MNKSNKLLSDIVAFRTYAKHLEHLGRRESLTETINRNMLMHLEKFPKLTRDLLKTYKQVHDLKVMPSMRSLQFGGDAILKNNTRIYNCSFVHLSYPRVFAEVLYVLLCGAGVGFSIQHRHIRNLPKLRSPRRENTHLVHDSIEGWSDAVDALMNGYFYGGIRPIFDYSQISAKGTVLKTTGAKAPGPEPLKTALQKVEEILKGALNRQLRSIELHDIICILADCVLAGGIRRAALISIFDRSDLDMLSSKQGEWWVKHSYRARANNSAILDRNEVTKEEFRVIYDAAIKSNCGEPGFIWSDDLEMGVNPCAEIALHHQQFCNLTTTNMTGITSEKDFHNRVYAASMLGTLQASYTDFPYLGDGWKSTTEDEALLGVSFTGIADSPNMTSDQLIKAAKLVLETNEKYAKILGINESSRSTCLKPEGSASCVLGSASGIHARHDEFFLRRIRINREESLARYLKSVIPDLVEDDIFNYRDVVVTIPQQSPKESILRHQESALQLLERVIFYNKYWVQPGFRSGNNQHNVSCTINYHPHEVDELFEGLWEYRNVYAGISILPFDGGSYQQAPFESCDEDTFQSFDKLVKSIDLTQVVEQEDNTTLMEQLACSGGVCEIR